ncbi:MAG: transcription termination factor Rho [Candidatus Daviesbacteria bacterium]|nr:transcription termination factor Rho [Candidatus Daviesbacteria bacterium]
MPRVTKSFKPKEEPIKAEETSVPIESGSVEQLVGEGLDNTDDGRSKIEDGNLKIENGGSNENNPPSKFYPQRSTFYSPSSTVRNSYPDRERDVPTENVSGVLDVMPEGHGFLRPKYIPSDIDVYISASQIRRFHLRPGDFVEGAARPPKETERYFGLLQVNKINGEDADKLMGEDGRPKKRLRFEDLTAIYPNKHLKLETGKEPLSQRVMDLVAPIGFGQRGLIVSSPKAGKTTILKDIATGVAKNHPDVVLMAVLVGERPEEVTDISRSIKGDVIASNFDEPAEAQTAAAEIALERAKRLVEQGKDVVILLDSVTRLGRAYNLSVPPSGRTLSGGFDPIALYPPKHFFGAARNCEEGGSLTIIGTALVDTGSRMDDLIYEEFKGTGNMELHLDRRIAERRVFPAIDIEASGTRQEQLLFKEDYYKQMIIMRRMIGILGENERTEIFLERLKKTDSNEDFLKTLKDIK